MLMANFHYRVDFLETMRRISLISCFGTPRLRLDSEVTNMSDFSLKLSDDQIGIQSWVHGFAEDVVRPAAEEWGERRISLPNR